MRRAATSTSIARGSHSPAARSTRSGRRLDRRHPSRRISARGRRRSPRRSTRARRSRSNTGCAGTTARTAGCSTTARRASTATARFAGYIGACLDITERKEAAATLGIFEQRKSAFLASLAHELRNPLAPIRSSVELLQRMPASDDPRVARAQEIIERNCARLAELVDDLLDLSRIDSGNIQLAREPRRRRAGDRARRRAARRAASRSAAAARRRRCRASACASSATPSGIEQMLGNPDRQCVEVHAAGRPSSPSAAARDDVRRDRRSTDSGAGIEHDMQPQLFDLFDRRAQPPRMRRSGSAPGLRIVARLARLHRRHRCASHSAGEDQGSTFVAAPAGAPTLRRTRQPVAGERPRRGAARGAAAHRRRQRRCGRRDRHAAVAERLRRSRPRMIPTRRWSGRSRSIPM